MAIPRESRRTLKDFVKIDTGNVNVGQIALYGAFGLFIGGVCGVLSQVAKLDIHGAKELDPPAPNMQQRDPELCSLFKKLMDEFYRLCPMKHKREYQRKVSNAIANAEAVMLIENQLLNNEIERNYSQISTVAAHASLCIRSLRKVEKMYDTPIHFNNVKDLIDVIFVKMCDHNMNVRILASPF